MYIKANILQINLDAKEQRETVIMPYEVMRAIYRHYVHKADQCTGQSRSWLVALLTQSQGRICYTA